MEILPAMHSIRTKITLFNVIAIVVAITVATIISAFSIAKLGHSGSEQSLRLLGETGRNNLDYYLKSVEQSTDTVSGLIDAQLDALPDIQTEETFHAHVEGARTIFKEAAEHTNGAMTYYYRIDPSISAVTKEPGFWYVNLDGKGFKENPVTDLSDEQYSAVWFNVPKTTGKPVWLPPYLTDNLDVYVLSYNVPVRWNGQFVGVIGIEIDYRTLGAQIKDIGVSNGGYAFIVENERGTIIYHPTIDLLTIPEEERPLTPADFRAGFFHGDHHIEYTFEGIRKHCYWMELTNGMSIVVTVPTSVVTNTWWSVVVQIVVAAAIIITVFAIATALSARQLTKPLKALTKAAEDINEGDYDVELDYKKDDEIGTLTTAMNKLVRNLGDYINDLSSLAYADALTSINNKNAFDARVHELQDQMNDSKGHLEFAVAILDCDDLKKINDSFGHDKGDIYLRNSCRLIVRVFQNSAVYRIGGDEFAVILEKDDYARREELKKLFVQRSEEICTFAKEPWEKIRISIGVAAYDPEIDESVKDVIVHADHLMYQNKRDRQKRRH